MKSSKSSPIQAWHFVADKLRDGSLIPADGEMLTHKGRVIPCQSGLHASVRLIDALRYAPGETLCRVECSGTIRHEEDKLAASKRVILWRIDASDMLRSFARQCALDVAHLRDMPEVVRNYLTTGDETLRQAAEAAAWSASWSATGPAAWSAAGPAAEAAAWSAARGAQNTRLESMAYEAHNMLNPKEIV